VPGVRIERHADPVAYRDLVTPVLLRDEARYNLELALIEHIVAGTVFGDEPPLLLSVHDGGEVTGAALMTPPWKLLMAPVPAAAVGDLAAYLADEVVPGALAGEEEVRTFADAYTAAAGVTQREGKGQGVYRLTTLVPPRPVPGALREATDDDFDLLVAWVEAFQRDAGLPEADARRNAARAREGLVWLWEDDGPVSMVGVGGFTPNGARVGPVYTPPERRGRGYASAATAAVTALMLDRGRAHTFLYTDLANPTSNKIYQAIGYEHVCDVLEVYFDR
jgi:predicted GNAT family acetyltransferase